MLPGLLVLISITQTHPPEILRSVKGKLQFGNEATIHASCSEQPSWRFVDPVQFSFGSFSVPTVRAHMIGVPASCTSVMGGIGEPCAAMGGPSGYPALFSCAWWPSSAPETGEAVSQGLTGDFHMEVHSGVLLGIGVFVD